MRCAMGWSTERLRACCLGIILAVATCASHGQVAVMEPYEEDAGLTSMAVACLAQAPDGRLWIGTDNGLFAFDGFQIRREPLPDGAGLVISDIQVDMLGSIWIATDTGPYVRRDDGGASRWRPIVRPDGIALGIDGKQRLTFDARGRAFAMDRRSRLWAIPAPTTQSATVVAAPLPMPAFEPFAGAFDADGGPIRAIGTALWFGCGRGVCRWVDGRLRTWGPDRGLPEDTWGSLVVARDGSLWARGIAHLARLAPGDDLFRSIDAPQARLWPATIATVEDPAGAIITATDDGLARWDGRVWTAWTPREGIPETAVRALFFDADRELWVGSAGRGLHRWVGYGRTEHWTTATGLPSPVVWGFARDGAGQLRIATSRGIAGPDVAAHRFGRIGPLFSPSAGAGLAIDEAGTTWWVDAGHVMSVASGASRAREAFFDPSIDFAVQAPHAIVLSGKKSAQWLLSSSGAPRRQPLPPGMPDPTSLAAVISDGRTNWFLIDKKAYRVDRGTWEALRDEHGTPVEVLGTATFADPSELWVADRHGVSIYKVTDGRARPAWRVEADRLGTASIAFLGRDRGGRMWIGTDRGVFVRSGVQWARLDRGNGLLWNDLDVGAVLFDSDGAVWIGSSMGATRVLAGNIDGRAARLRVEELRFGDRPVSVTSAESIAWPDRNMRLTLGTPQIARGRSTRLEYRLNDAAAWEGFAGNVLQLGSLDAGDYRVQVRAAASTPILQAGAPLEISFSIAPPWWRSTTARIAYVIALAAAWFLSMQMMRARARAMRGQLEQAIAERTVELERSRELVRSLGVHNTRLLEEERKRVARELHDEMGQQLAALRMEISVLRRRAAGSDAASTEAALGMLLVRVEALVAGMRSVVAELRPPALDGGLAAALEWLVAAFERHADLPCDAEIDDCATLLAPDAAVMVFRIAQESLNNVHRHARAGQASLRLTRAESACELTIIDDGVGFAPAARNSGYGILGMEERAIALGGTLVITSTSSKGCTVRLRLPLPDTESAPAPP
jgi:signal transduction histidine kinase